MPSVRPAECPQTQTLHVRPAHVRSPEQCRPVKLPTGTETLFMWPSVPSGHGDRGTAAMTPTRRASGTTPFTPFRPLAPHEPGSPVGFRSGMFRKGTRGGVQGGAGSIAFLCRPLWDASSLAVNPDSSPVRWGLLPFPSHKRGHRGKGASSPRVTQR